MIRSGHLRREFNHDPPTIASLHPKVPRNGRVLVRAVIDQDAEAERRAASTGQSNFDVNPNTRPLLTSLQAGRRRDCARPVRAI